jgi:hypothetical protein
VDKMPLMLACSCGHSGPLPATSGRFVCSACKAAVEFTWFESPGAFDRWKLWLVRSGRLLPEAANRPHVEYVAATT